MIRTRTLATGVAALALVAGSSTWAVAATRTATTTAAAPTRQAAPADGAEVVVAPDRDVDLVFTTCGSCGESWSVVTAPAAAVATVAKSSESDPCRSATCGVPAGATYDVFRLHARAGGRTTLVLQRRGGGAPAGGEVRTFRVVVPQTFTSCVVRGEGTLYRTTTGVPRCASGDGVIGWDSATAQQPFYAPRATARVSAAGTLVSGSGVLRVDPVDDGACVAFEAVDPATAQVLLTPAGDKDVLLRLGGACRTEAVLNSPARDGVTVVAHDLTGTPVRAGFSLLVP